MRRQAVLGTGRRPRLRSAPVDRSGLVGQETLLEPATGRECSLCATSLNRQSPPSIPRAELGIQGLNR